MRSRAAPPAAPGSPAGLQKEDITLAEILKTRGYATPQFGKNHLGDLEEHLPHRHSFDEFWGNLYHLNGNEDLEDPDRPTNPEFRQKYDPRGIVSGTADGPTKDEGPLTVKRMETFDDEVTSKSLDSSTGGQRTGSHSSFGTTRPPARFQSSEGAVTGAVARRPGGYLRQWPQRA
jgi:arylsulfatase A-like enzyme